MWHPRRYHQVPKASPKGTEEYRGSLNGQCEDYARCEPDTTGVTDCVHRSGGSRAPTPADY